MLIDDVVCVPVRSGFFTDDQAAIRLDPRQDGFNLQRSVSDTPGSTECAFPDRRHRSCCCLTTGRWHTATVRPFNMPEWEVGTFPWTGPRWHSW